MKSTILVTIQFSAVLFLTVMGPFPSSIPSLLLLAAGALLGGTAIITMRLDNLRIFPEPKKDIRLVTAGPYRYIRHPMYTALLIMMSAWPTGTWAPIPIGVWSILAVVLVMKMRIEERMLPLVIPEYRQYQERTWKLIPYIY